MFNRRSNGSRGRVRMTAAGATGTAIAAAGTVAAVAGLVNRRRRKGAHPIRRNGEYVTVRAVTVARPVTELIRSWSDLDLLRVAFDRPVRLTRIDEHRWRCLVGASEPGDDGCSAEVTSEDGGRVLRWRIDQGPTAHQGRLELTPAPGDRGTELRVELRYGQRPVDRVTGMFSGADPDRMLRTVLRRAKSRLECGTVLSAMDEPAARGAGQERATREIREKLATGGRP